MRSADQQNQNKLAPNEKAFSKSRASQPQIFLSFQKRLNNEKDEYSDPDINEDSNELETKYQRRSLPDDNYSEEDKSTDESDDDHEDSDGDYDDFDQLPEIDQINISKPEKISRYAETIYSVVRQDVTESLSCTVSSDIIKTTQKEVTPSLHELAVKWIFQVHQEYKMSSDTLYESIAYLNVILSRTPIRQDQLQLVAVTCIWMASKVEERTIPKLEELSYICRYKYKEDDFVKCEKNLLKLLDFKLSYPTSKMFLRRLLDSISAEQQIIEVSTFFCDLSLMILDLIDFTPMTIAMASVCLGKLCLNSFCPTMRLLAYSHLQNLDEVKKCAFILIQSASNVLSDKEHILFKKFTQDDLIGSIREIDSSINVFQMI